MQAISFNSTARPSTIAVVGLGKIGLPLAIQYARQGYKVIGCDINASVVEQLNAGHSHIHEEAELALELPLLLMRGLFSATTYTTGAVHNADVVVVIVPVCIDEQHHVDFAAIEAATTAVGEGLRPGTLVIYETTLPVGTTARYLRPQLENIAGLRAGTDFSLAYSPERVSSGKIFRDLRTYPKVVGGIDEQSTIRAAAFYRAMLGVEIITMASTDEAEFVKLIETTYRDVNIALANEYACYADSHGLNVHTAIAAANTQPYSHIHVPGVGVGGHCIPVYPYFLFANPNEDAGAEEGDDALIMARSARRVNDSMADYAVQRLEKVVGTLAEQAVLILGVAYRGNVRETAFTSARLLQEALLQRGALVYADDPLYSVDELSALGYRPLPEGYDDSIRAIIVQCNHSDYRNFDFARFSTCIAVLDGRHALPRAIIEALGMHYLTIGQGSVESAQPREHAYSLGHGVR